MQRTSCLLEVVWSGQQAPAPKDTIQNFQLCSVEERTYSSNMLRIWSKRWRVMGTPVAGSCSWHRLRGTSSCGGSLCRRLGAAGTAPRQHPSPQRGWAGSVPVPGQRWCRTAPPREHRPCPRRGLGVVVLEVLRSPAASCCLPGAATCPAWLPRRGQWLPPAPPTPSTLPPT